MTGATPDGSIGAENRLRREHLCGALKPMGGSTPTEPNSLDEQQSGVLFPLDLGISVKAWLLGVLSLESAMVSASHREVAQQLALRDSVLSRRGRRKEKEMGRGNIRGDIQTDEFHGFHKEIGNGGGDSPPPCEH